MNNPIVFMDPNGLDTIDLSLTINLPTFPGSPTIPGSETVKPRGASIGIAISYPGFMGGEFDIGAIGSVNAGGSHGLGTGKVTLGLTYSDGSVRDQRGQSTEVSFNDGIGGLAFGFDDINNLTSVGIHLGPGFEAAVDGKIVGHLSLRDLINSIFGNKIDCE